MNTKVSELQMGTALEISARISQRQPPPRAENPRPLGARRTGGAQQPDVGDRAALVERERQHELPSQPRASQETKVSDGPNSQPQSLEASRSLGTRQLRARWSAWRPHSPAELSRRAYMRSSVLPVRQLLRHLHGFMASAWP